jgi:hypothetical protein
MRSAVKNFLKSVALREHARTQTVTLCELAMVQYDAAPKLMTLLLFIDLLSLSGAGKNGK